MQAAHLNVATSNHHLYPTRCFCTKTRLRQAGVRKLLKMQRMVVEGRDKEFSPKGLLAVGPVLQRKRESQMHGTPSRSSVRFIQRKVGNPGVSKVRKFHWGRGPFWRREMSDSRVYRKFWPVLGIAALLSVAGCSSEPNVASNTAPAPAKKAAPSQAAAPAPKKEAKHVGMATGPKGTAISATVGQTLTSKKNKAGDTFAATLSAPVMLDGKTVLP